MRFEAETEDPAVTRIVVSYEAGGKTHKIEVRMILEGKDAARRFRKEILFDGRKTTAQSAIGEFPAVLFLPHMTEMITGAPSERRRYLNILLSQSIRGYARVLSQYSRGVLQRNALLRTLAERGGDPSQLTYWDELLATQGAYLTLHRAQAIAFLERTASAASERLTEQGEILTLKYQPALKDADLTEILLLGSESERITALTERIQSDLSAERRLDIRRGTTSIGPHRDELRIFANEIDVGVYGSRGQVRTALLALKFAEVEWLRDKTGMTPLLLLDETFAELDQARRRELMRYLQDAGQGIITTTDPPEFEPDFTLQRTVWEVTSVGLRKEPAAELDDVLE